LCVGWSVDAYDISRSVDLLDIVRAQEA
jgi:hypothetical protein